jgi:hypothetical protein
MTLTTGARSPLRMLLKRCEAVAMEVASSPTQDLVEASTRVALLDEAIKQLDVARREAKNQVIILTDTGKQVVATPKGSLILNRTETITRKNWRHVELATKVITTAAELGQLTGPKDAAPLFCEMATISYWKGDRRAGSGLFRLGIDKDDYCDVNREGHVTVDGSVA